MAEPITIIISQGGENGTPYSGNNAITGASASRTAAVDYLSKGKLPGIGGASAFDKSIASAATVVGLGSLNYALSNYGNMTGNYVAQDKINEAKEVAQTIAGIAGFSISSAMTASLLGGSAAVAAPVGAVVAIAGVAVKVGTSIMSYNLNVSKQTTRTEFLRQLTGNPVYSGSRGTDN